VVCLGLGQVHRQNRPEHTLMPKRMGIVPSMELQRSSLRYLDEAMIRSVSVCRNGRLLFVMVRVDKYERLRPYERMAGSAETLDDGNLAAIRALEPLHG
jgi:hypothetical protein